MVPMRHCAGYPVGTFLGHIQLKVADIFRRHHRAVALGDSALHRGSRLARQRR